MPHNYSFDENMRMSQGIAENASVQEILMENIPGAVRIVRASENEDRHGTDWWVERSCGAPLSVDDKVRRKDWAQRGEDDLALETFSVVERGKIGWTRDPNKRTDYVLWFWKDTGRWVLVPFPMLCSVFSRLWETWKGQYKTAIQHTDEYSGYHSECVFVPRKLVWSEIYRQFGGKPLEL